MKPPNTMLVTLFLCVTFIAHQSVFGEVREKRLVGGLLGGLLGGAPPPAAPGAAPAAGGGGLLGGLLNGLLGGGGGGLLGGLLGGGGGAPPPPPAGGTGTGTGGASGSAPGSAIDTITKGIQAAIAALLTIIQQVQQAIANKAAPSSSPTAPGQNTGPALAIAPSVLTGRLIANEADIDAVNVINRSVYYLKVMQLKNPKCQNLGVCGGAHTLKHLKERLTEYSEPLQLAISTVMKAVQPFGVTDEAIKEKATNCQEFLKTCPEATQIPVDK